MCCFPLFLGLVLRDQEPPAGVSSPSAAFGRASGRLRACFFRLPPPGARRAAYVRAFSVCRLGARVGPPTGVRFLTAAFGRASGRLRACFIFRLPPSGARRAAYGRAVSDCRLRARVGPLSGVFFCRLPAFGRASGRFRAFFFAGGRFRAPVGVQLTGVHFYFFFHSRIRSFLL